MGDETCTDIKYSLPFLDEATGHDERDQRNMQLFVERIVRRDGWREQINASQHHAMNAIRGTRGEKRCGHEVTKGLA